MPTSFLNLTTNTQASGSATTFLTWRLAMNDESNSNATKIDTYAQNISASVTALQLAVSFAVNATESTTNNYVATVTGFTSYTDKKLINLMLNVTQTGTTTLNINSLGTKSLYKIGSNGVAGNLDSGDLVAGRPNFFMYDTAGGYWLWVNGTSADQINIATTTNTEILLGSASGIVGSGISASSLSTNDGYFLVSQLSSNLRNESQLTAGSGTKIENDVAASKIYLHTNLIPGSGISLINNTTASTIQIVNNIISGSGITIENNTTASNLTINSNIIANPNVIINGGFTINQRIYTSDSFSASGTYMHDRWVSGSAGGRYTFTQLNSPTSITIASGCSIIQKIENKSIGGTTYTLSWQGTAQARWGINSYTPSGSYVTSPVTIMTQTAGSPMSVEFNGGTLGKVKLEEGINATPFVSRPYGDELKLCKRYCKDLSNYMLRMKYYTANVIAFEMKQISHDMRITPTITSTSFSVDAVNGSAQTGFALGTSSDRDLIYNKTSHGLTDGILYFNSGYASAEL